jgi:hypothetical protein
MEVELFSCKSQLSQSNEELLKIKKEIEEKDLQNYELSSNLYKIESEASSKI